MIKNRGSLMTYKSGFYDWSIKDLEYGIDHALGYIEDDIAYDSDLEFIEAAKAELNRRIGDLR